MRKFRAGRAVCLAMAVLALVFAAPRIHHWLFVAPPMDPAKVAEIDRQIDEITHYDWGSSPYSADAEDCYDSIKGGDAETRANIRMLCGQMSDLRK